MKNNPFLVTKNAKDRLMRYVELHGKLYIAYDFDDTVASYPDGEPYEDVINLLKKAKAQGHHLILFTANEGSELERRVKLCKEWGIEPEYVNESPLSPNKRKPHFNILIDDHAGLANACQQLAWLIEQINLKNQNV